MKKFLLSAILPLFYFISVIIASFSYVAPIRAHADTYSGQTYACILSDDVFFYAAPDERRGVFLLPKTYYVKILDANDDYCKIEYLYDDDTSRKLTGYAKTSQLTFVPYTPLRPYLYYVFDVKYQIENAPIGDSSFLNQITVTCVYYGDYKVGSETYCYVLRGDTFGYITKPSTISYEENPEYADYLAQINNADSSSPSAPRPDESSPAQIAILIALCLLVPVLAALILKPPRRPPYESDE